MPAAGAPQGAPEFQEIVAPAAWRVIDFISDLHLSADMPRTAQAAYRYLRSTNADAVFILGDLFEVWVGDDAAARPFEQACLAEIAAAARQRALAFMPGNRDFLVGAGALRASGMRSLGDPTRLLAFGQVVLLSHGDGLCLGDTAYQAFRREVRSAAWQSGFLAHPLEVRLHMAADMRRASAARRHFDGDGSSDVDAPMALNWLHAAQATTLVHGHTHRPGSEALAPGLMRHVLTDWDLDHAQRAQVLRLTPSGFERVALGAA